MAWSTTPAASSRRRSPRSARRGGMRPHLKVLHTAVPLQRLGTESEVSAAITFLLSPAAAFISGTVLRVDGAAPTARLASPLSALLPGAEENARATKCTWPLLPHER